MFTKTLENAQQG